MKIFRFVFIFFYVFVLSAISWYINGKSFIGIDDANIYLIYMKHFSEGFGFVYHVGGEKVEGFTSLLWTLIGSVFYHLSTKPEKYLILLNIVIISYTIYCICQYLDKLYQSSFFSRPTWFVLAILAFTPGFIDWTIMSIMETGLWCCLLTLVSLRTLTYGTDDSKKKHYLYLSILYGLMIVCRPESILWIPLFIFINAYKEFKSIKTFNSTFFTRIIYPLGTYIIFLVLLTIWRINYFGYPLPNTYYAKVSSNIIDNLSKGITYISYLFLEKPYILLILLQATVFILYSRNRNKFQEKSIIYIMYFIIIVSLLIPLYSGGDHFKLHRFIIPTIPIFLILWSVLLEKIVLKKTELTFMVVFFVFFSNSYNSLFVWTSRSYPLMREFEIAAEGRQTANHLNTFFTKAPYLPSQGVIAAGASGYEYKGETIDLLGLNNTKMAHAEKIKNKDLPKNHASFNTNVFLELKPDLFWYQATSFADSNEPIPTFLSIDPANLSSKIFQNIQLNKTFKNEYGYYYIHKKNSNDCLKIFAKKKYISLLDQSYYQIYMIPYN